eukprot:55624-Rhodomonas_salina.1
MSDPFFLHILTLLPLSAHTTIPNPNERRRSCGSRSVRVAGRSMTYTRARPERQVVRQGFGGKTLYGWQDLAGSLSLSVCVRVPGTQAAAGQRYGGLCVCGWQPGV